MSAPKVDKIDLSPFYTYGIKGIYALHDEYIVYLLVYIKYEYYRSTYI